MNATILDAKPSRERGCSDLAFELPFVLVLKLALTFHVCWFLYPGVRVSAADPPPTAQPAAAGDAQSYRLVIEPLVRRYCLDCHGEEKPAGNVSLAGLKGDVGKARELSVWQAVLDKLDSREMPPADADQPSDADRSRATGWLIAALKTAGVTWDESRWLAPTRGNDVDHRALFEPKQAPPTPAATNPRLWRLSGQSYENYFDRLITHFRLGLRNYGEHKITAPWNFTPQREFADYASAHRVGEAEIEFLLRNAAIVAGPIIKRHAGRKPSYGGYIPELATLVKAGDAATPEQAEAAVAPAFQSLFQRPPTPAESRRYGEFAKKSLAAAGGEGAAEQLLIALLCQTELIHRIEVSSGPERRLAPRDLARSIAFSLTDQQPDETLVQAATDGQLASREGVATQVRRLLEDSKVAKPRVLRFFREYFGYSLAPTIFKDEMTLRKSGFRDARGWNPDYFVSDADRIVLAALAEDRDVLRQLLTTTRTFAMTVDPADQVHTKIDAYRLKKPTLEADEQNLIRIYGIEIKSREDWQPTRQYDFPAGQRLGLLTHPAWLVAHSSNFDNHAIQRGRWIRERLLGGRIPDLPITVNAMLPDEPHRTLRDRMRVTRDTYCWTCHQRMDPLGLPFEQFDHFGQFHREEMVADLEATSDKRNLNKNGQPRQMLYKPLPLDTSGELLDAIDQRLEGPVNDPFELIRRLADSELVEQVFVRHVFRYFLGRNETLADGPTLVAAHRAYRTHNGSMNALLESLLSSDSFLLRAY
jgi:hypothetical protein